MLLRHADCPRSLLALKDVRGWHLPIKNALEALIVRLKAALRSDDAGEARKWTFFVDRLEPILEQFLGAVHRGPTRIAAFPAPDTETIARAAVRRSLETKFRDADALRDKLRVKAAEAKLAGEGERPVVVSLTHEGKTILEAIQAERPLTVVQRDLEEPTHLCLRTIRKELKYLLQAGLVHKPHGPKKGYALTDKGVALLTTENPGSG